MINGNGWVAKTAIGGLLSVISFMGYGVVNNDIRNTEQHIEIRKEMIERHEEVTETVADMRVDVKGIAVEQRMQRVLLERIEKKL